MSDIAETLAKGESPMNEPMKFTASSTLNTGGRLAFGPPKADCAKHGEVEVFTLTGYDRNGEYAKHDLCPKCYIEWVVANVSPVQRKPYAPE